MERSVSTLETFRDDGGTYFVLTLAAIGAVYGFHKMHDWFRDPLDFKTFRKLQEDVKPPPVIHLKGDEGTVPYIAWPTVFVLVGGLALWVGSGIAYATELLPLKYTWMIGAAGIYWMFTPLHDAVHSAASRVRFINEVVGHISGIPFVFGFPIFRFIHLSHHKYNNDGSHDPDFWAGEGPWYMLPFRWATIICYYIHWVLERRQHELKETGALGAPLARALEVVQPALFVFVGFLFASWRYGWLLWATWILPALAASTFLVFMFDYIPHRPHVYSDRENPYLATSLTSGLLSVTELTPVMLYQNYHLIHHLRPNVPFYKYSEVYRNHRKEIHENGAKILPLVAILNHEVPKDK